MKNLQIQSVLIKTVQLFLLVFIVSFFIEVGYKFIKNWAIDQNLLSQWFDSTLTARKIGIWLAVTLGFAIYQVHFRKEK
jgi:hypothetical protein